MLNLTKKQADTLGTILRCYAHQTKEASITDSTSLEFADILYKLSQAIEIRDDWMVGYFLGRVEILFTDV